MKYFTADLLRRFGSEDAPTANAAQEEWEQVCERYNAYLDSIKGQMTPGLRQVEESYSLHDARVCGMGQDGQSFVIVLRLDTPPHPLLTLTFDLLGEPGIDTTALPQELCSTGDVVAWQYDELELLPGNPQGWRWSILFSNGWEVRLHFRDVRVQAAQAILPTPRNGKATGTPVSQPA